MFNVITGVLTIILFILSFILFINSTLSYIFNQLACGSIMIITILCYVFLKLFIILIIEIIGYIVKFI
jgi:hypothetical protein